MTRKRTDDFKCSRIKRYESGECNDPVGFGGGKEGCKWGENESCDVARGRELAVTAENRRGLENIAGIQRTSSPFLNKADSSLSVMGRKILARGENISCANVPMSR